MMDVVRFSLQYVDAIKIDTKSCEVCAGVARPAAGAVAVIKRTSFAAEARVPAFYPSMFVLVTDVLDTFGRCVFERLRSAAVEEQARMGSARGGALPEDFAAGDVGAEARETCRNWIYKTACIRELLPRLYVEISLLECYRFLHPTADFAPILARAIAPKQRTRAIAPKPLL
jgi:hypothetical protein